MNGPAERAAGRAARVAARLGIAANGVLHLLVAWLATRVALGGGERADQAGALQAVAAEPGGRPLLWLVVVGFAAVVFWRLREATGGFPGPGRHLDKRLFAVGQVAVYTGLAVLTLRAATGSSAGTGGQGVTAAVLRLPAGQWLVAAVGVGVLVTGVVMVVQGARMRFTEDMRLHEAGPIARALARRTGQVGAVSKGLAMTIIGGLVVLAAVTYQPARAEGLDVALKTIAAQPFGAVALLGVAFGLASFGVFCLFDARYHEV
ncbi:DUF1206 domain-containing protein [Pseudonocardia eucalypti]|uniref:DUF1206 domain-containing protein n=1 Tax=Pseudonocardia eucalypti TaxID=648755 RepID=A0ABP9Q8S0_9PSEU|nr:hypothetical protein [Pseudonocardia eucalypti]